MYKELNGKSMERVKERPGENPKNNLKCNYLDITIKAEAAIFHLPLC